MPVLGKGAAGATTLSLALRASPLTLAVASRLESLSIWWGSSQWRWVLDFVYVRCQGVPQSLIPRGLGAAAGAQVQ